MKKSLFLFVTSLLISLSGWANDTGYCGGDGTVVGTESNAQWWGVTTEEEFKDEYRHAKNGKQLGDESFKANMTLGTDGTNGLELCSFNLDNVLNLDPENGTELAAGTIIGVTPSIVATIGADDTYKPQWRTFTVGDVVISGGLQGCYNPKDVDGEVPAVSLCPPVSGAFLQFEAKADGFLYVLFHASSNKAYSVFENGAPIGYTFAAIGDANSDLGAVYQFELTGEGEFNYVRNSIEWAEREYLKRIKPEVYASRLTTDEEGNTVWSNTDLKINGAGVIKFPIYAGCKYIVNANKSKIPVTGFVFCETDNVTIKSENVVIMGSADSASLNDDDTFTAKTVEGVEMTFKVISASDKTCQVGDGKNLAIDKDYSGALTIPSEINGFRVTAIAGWSLYGCSLISVSIPNSVKSIGERAFQLCKNLSSINFPNLLTSIGECAFNSCHQLNSITIPKSVTSIGYAAFSNIWGLNSLVVENGNTEYDSRGDCNAIICTRNNELIAGCQNTIIPSSVTIIGRQAFLACSGLTSLTIPNSVTSIGYNAFHGCTSLTEITIPASITDITNGAFGNCINIGKIVVESGNKVYDSRENCNAVIKTETNELIIGCHNSVIPNSVSKIGEEAFYYCTALNSINIPNSVEVIGRSAFYACTNLNAISLPRSLTIIEDYAFKYCSSLISVTVDINKPLEINENVFSIQSNAVLYVPKGCIEAYRTAENWKEFGRIIEIGGSDETVLYDGDTFKVKTVEGVEMTFKVISSSDRTCQVGDDNNPAIDTSYKGTLTIPATANDYRVTTIGSWALSGCYGITDLIISEGIESLMDNCIEWCDNVTSIVLPASVTYLSESFGGFSRTLKFISVASGNKVFDSRENCNAIIETATNILRCGCVNTVIPTSVTAIGAWSMCDKLESIIIPEHITAIGEGALRYNRYEEITIPASVKTIGAFAFESCWNLKKVNILSEKCDIGFDAFADCAMLKTVNSYQKSPTAIPNNAFSNSYSDDNLPVLNDDLTLYVPFGTKSLYETTDGWKNFKVIKEFVEEDGVAFAVEDDKTVSLKENNGPSEKEVEIPASVIIEGESYPVTAIGENAFENNETLELMTIPETINEICDGAFAGCSGLKAIYCYAEDPIALGSESAKVRTRADGEDISASTVFAEVDKESCILYVPKNCGYKYRAAGGWSEFRNIVEILSDEAGDANNDGKVDDRDIETITKYVLNGDTNDFIFKNANVNGDKTINVSDIVIIVNMIK